MTTNPNDHLDYAEEAESAQRASAWPQAAALWRRAAATCNDAKRRSAYEDHARRCDGEVAVDERLAAIARRHLRIPTLEARNADHLDFHEVDVWGLLAALRAAYRVGRDQPERVLRELVEAHDEVPSVLTAEHWSAARAVLDR